MKFKIEKGTELFKQFQELLKKANEVETKAIELVKTLTGSDDSKYMPNTSLFELYGGIIGIVFDTKPDDKKWRLLKCNYKNVYVPNKKTKEGKEIQKSFDELPQVKTSELNNLINLVKKNETYWSRPGFSHNIEDNVIILDMPKDVSYKWYKPHADMVEITEKEYFALDKE